MIADTDKILEMVEKYANRYSNVQDFIYCHQWLDKLMEHTKDLRSSEKLLEMPKQQLISIISNLYAVGPGAFKLNKILEDNTIEEVQDAIFILLYGEGEIEDRLVMARRSGMGISFLTQTLCFFDPTKYSIKDRLTKIGLCLILGYGNIVPGNMLDDELGAKPYDDMSYSEFHKLVSEVGKHFIMKILHKADDDREELGKYINPRKYLIIDQFLRYSYSKWK